MYSLKSFITTLIILLTPINILKVFFLKLMGHQVSFKARIGMSFIRVKRLVVEEGARIGRLNYIKIEELRMEQSSSIKHANLIRGPFKLWIREKGSMTSQNKIRRAYPPITYGISVLEIGTETHIVSNQFLDLTKSIKFGSRSQVAGIGAQFWTHGYIHFKNQERARIDGDIRIGDNVYIGSRCVFNAGVTVGDNITIGSNSTISKDLLEPGLYVNQPLRMIQRDEESFISKLRKVEDEGLLENVYEKI